MSFYGTDFAAARRKRYENYLTNLSGFAQKKQAAGNIYAAGEAGINQEKPRALRSILNNSAGRGMAYSSGYGEKVSDANSGFAQQLANLGMQRDSEINSANLDQSREDSSYNYDIADLQSQQASYEASQQQALVAALAEQQQQQAQLELTQAQTQQALTPPAQAQHNPVGGAKKTPFSGLRRRAW